MSAFAGQGHQGSVGEPHAAGHAQPCARTEDGDRTLGISLPLLQHNLLLLAQMGEPIDQHGEIIHQLQLLETPIGSQGGLVELPGQVGDVGAPLTHGSGHGDAAGGHLSAVVVVIAQKALQHWPEVGPFR